MTLRSFVLVPWLVAAWVLLWGSVSVANVASGVVVAVVLLVVFPLERDPDAVRHVLRPLPALRLAAYFAGQLAISNVDLTREILRRRDHIRTGVIAVEMEGVSPALLALVANMTALTPGTLVVEVTDGPPTFYVHVLHLYDADAVRASLRKLERLAIEAFGPRAAVTAMRCQLGVGGGA